MTSFQSSLCRWRHNKSCVYIEDTFLPIAALCRVYMKVVVENRRINLDLNMKSVHGLCCISKLFVDRTRVARPSMRVSKRTTLLIPSLSLVVSRSPTHKPKCFGSQLII